ncbi:hypothetical protein AW736_05305 [Termitidicoccus mucosus]|uniref:Uncharacterized protein n=1 Tax=Termitidicoccus mucosus TaxID=1184151 RepID=A0A178INY1_9BACT|nr:hypothetical protein AW736_05305 [Opitutaceae bacterium TSB47]
MKLLGLLGALSHQAMPFHTCLIHDEAGLRLCRAGQAAVITSPNDKFSRYFGKFSRYVRRFVR